MPAKKTTKNRAAMVAALAASMLVASPEQVAAERAGLVADAPRKPLAHLRVYQREVFADKVTKVLVLEWSRQIGKSHTLAHWACDRLMMQLATKGRKAWTIVVISNSKGNGAEFGVKCSEALALYAQAAAEISQATGALPEELKEFGLEVEDCQYRLGVTLKVMEDGVEVTKTGRILILSASPRTARGFSADLILDEWAFHENAAKMWAAAEPIISSNPEFLCRVASTHNGPNSLFARWIRRAEFPVHSMKRSQAWAASKDDPVFPLVITSLKTKRSITPAEALAEAGDRREYLQNYENEPSAESGSLLTWELIAKAERAPRVTRCEQKWDSSVLQDIYRLPGEFYIGQDVGRNRDVSVVAVLQRIGAMRRVVGLLRMKQTRIDHQTQAMQVLMDVLGPRVQRIAIDATGLGTGLADNLMGIYGSGLVLGVNFSSTVPITDEALADGRKATTMAVTERMAVGLARLFDDGLIEIPSDKELSDSLHLPERVVSANGKRVMIASEKTQDEDGSTEHADHFWALALAEYGSQQDGGGAFSSEDVGGVSMGGGMAIQLGTPGDIFNFSKA